MDNVQYSGRRVLTPYPTRTSADFAPACDSQLRTLYEMVEADSLPRIRQGRRLTLLRPANVSHEQHTRWREKSPYPISDQYVSSRFQALGLRARLQQLESAE